MAGGEGKRGAANHTDHSIARIAEKTIEELAAREGFSVSQFLASAAGEKLAVVMTIDYLRREAAAGRREDFQLRTFAAARTLPHPTNFAFKYST
jgi:hypothetical protein